LLPITIWDFISNNKRSYIPLNQPNFIVLIFNYISLINFQTVFISATCVLHNFHIIKAVFIITHTTIFITTTPYRHFLVVKINKNYLVKHSVYVIPITKQWFSSCFGKHSDFRYHSSTSFYHRTYKCSIGTYSAVSYMQSRNDSKSLIALSTVPHLFSGSYFV